MALKTFDPSEPGPNERITSREESVAVLLKALPAEVAERVLGKMDSDFGVRLRARMRGFSGSGPAPDSLEQLMIELDRRLNLGQVVVAPPSQKVSQAEQVATETKHQSPQKKVEKPVATRQESVTESKEELESQENEDEAEPTQDREVIAKLRGWDIEHLATALLGEQSSVVATVLNCLEPNKAGQVLKYLPQDIGKEAFISLLGSRPSAPLTTQVARTVMQKSKALRENPMAQVEQQRGDEKYGQMAGLLRSLLPNSRNQMLKALEQLDSEAAAKVKDQLYTFSDLLLVDDRSIQKLLGEINTELLTLSLIGAAGNIKDKILRNLSRRARESLYEEMEARQSVVPAKIRESQQAIVKAMLHLDSIGELAWVS